MQHSIRNLVLKQILKDGHTKKAKQNLGYNYYSLNVLSLLNTLQELKLTLQKMLAGAHIKKNLFLQLFYKFTSKKMLKNQRNTAGK